MKPAISRFGLVDREDHHQRDPAMQVPALQRLGDHEAAQEQKDPRVGVGRGRADDVGELKDRERHEWQQRGGRNRDRLRHPPRGHEQRDPGGAPCSRFHPGRWCCYEPDHEKERAEKQADPLAHARCLLCGSTIPHARVPNPAMRIDTMFPIGVSLPRRCC